LLACGITTLVLLVCSAWSSTDRTLIDARVQVDRCRVSAHERIALTILVRNPGKLSARAMQGSLSMGESRADVRIPALAPYRSERITRTYMATNRAAIQIGRFSVRVGDPFALIRRQDILTDTLTVYVHPRILDLNLSTAVGPRDIEGQTHGGTVDDDLDFHGLRPYAPGDDIRNVHWLSSAKSDELMIRQYESTVRAGCALNIDLDPNDYHSREEFELAISLGASLGARALRETEILFIPGKAAYRRAENVVTLLDWCSTLEPKARLSSDVPYWTPRPPNAATHYLAVGSLADINAIRRMAAALHSRTRTVVLWADIGATMFIRQTPDFTLARFGDLEELAAAAAGGAL
jgi:uncharacterized protein (DUF58 family)